MLLTTASQAILFTLRSFRLQSDHSFWMCDGRDIGGLHQCMHVPTEQSPAAAAMDARPWLADLVLCMQVLLTGQPALVSLAGALLETIVDHNREALARLPSTGIFFFALAYCGSNLVELARLFHVRPVHTLPRSLLS